VAVKTRLLSLALIFGVFAQLFVPTALDAAPAAKKAPPKKKAVAKPSKPAPPARVAKPKPKPKPEDSVGSIPAVLDPDQPPPVQARSVLVFNPRTGRILYERNADERRPVASTQKLLTGLIVAESGTLSLPVQVASVDTLCEPTKLYFKPGEIYTRRELLTALLVHSCNDVARCLARDNAGSVDAFADRMNQRAASLGARDSHFVNPNGLPSPGDPQWSTARDMARIARAAYFNPIIRQVVSMRRMAFRFNDGRVAEFDNTNKVLRRYELCTGMKTGYTEAAGRNLISSASNGDRSVIVVCLGDTRAIWNDSQALLAWGLIANENVTAPDL
jgi:D-alanyl-D-alanine carboxypeptidase (penicillin-binding protein 5/6)